jgi:hypothetical protein
MRARASRKDSSGSLDSLSSYPTENVRGFESLFFQGPLYLPDLATRLGVLVSRPIIVLVYLGSRTARSIEFSIINNMVPTSGLKINAQRLNETLQSTCTSWGALAAPSTGMCRLTLSQEDKQVRDWLVAQCKDLGCEVKIDQIGNIFAIRPGTATNAKPIGMGSHLDTQPAGKNTISALHIR